LTHAGQYGHVHDCPYMEHMLAGHEVGTLFRRAQPRIEEALIQA
jgi:hypothetical protein